METLPYTSREAVIQDFKNHDTITTEKTIAWELKVRELEEEGLTRSDAQGCADAQMGDVWREALNDHFNKKIPQR